jgi:hypothetical protein
MKGAVTQLAIGKILGLLFIKMLTEYDVPSQLGGLCEASKRKKKRKKKERERRKLPVQIFPKSRIARAWCVWIDHNL